MSTFRFLSFSALAGLLWFAVPLDPASAQRATVPDAAALRQWSESYAAEYRQEYALALAALEPLLETDPDHEFALMRRGWLHYLNGDLNESIRDYQRALELNEASLEAKLGLMLPLLAQLRFRQAAAYGQQVLEVAPWNYFAHVRLMVAEEGQRQWSRLAAHAEEVGRRYPSDPTIQVYLARSLVQLGDAAGARTAYGRVLERAPLNEEAAAFVAGR